MSDPVSYEGRAAAAREKARRARTPELRESYEQIATSYDRLAKHRIMYEARLLAREKLRRTPPIP